MIKSLSREARGLAARHGSAAFIYRHAGPSARRRAFAAIVIRQFIYGENGGRSRDASSLPHHLTPQILGQHVVRFLHSPALARYAASKFGDIVTSHLPSIA